MNLLASIPVWVYTAILIITFIGAHVLAFRPNEPGGKGIVRAAMRVGSAVLLVVGIVLVQPHEPGSVLLAIGAAALGGFVSGRAAPPLPRKVEPNVADEQTLEDPAS
ncbi:MAG TPA: hypothetical protein VFN03_02630 [Trueperaceae bacterium]|nr:hypothetical protein [Trueperaceae bacterium]